MLDGQTVTIRKALNGSAADDYLICTNAKIDENAFN